MIVCKDMNNWSGRFGNRIFCLNSLIQISHYFGQELYCKKFNGAEIFTLYENLQYRNEVEPEIHHEIDMNSLSNKSNVKLDREKNLLLDWNVNEFFFEYSQLSTYKILEYKEEYLVRGLGMLNKMSPGESKKIAIHFRGNDYSLWDPKSLLPKSYYQDSIEEFMDLFGKDTMFNLFTDDYSLPSFTETIQYLILEGCRFCVSNGLSWSDDLIAMAYSDGIISSPSTFCMVAGFTGKEGKKIIHSKDWVDKYRAKSDYFRDVFWKELLEKKGNDNYKLYKTL